MSNSSDNNNDFYNRVRRDRSYSDDNSFNRDRNSDFDWWSNDW